MFYEQTKIDAFLWCGKCNEKFDEPRMLPCGYTVCNSCIKTLVKTTDKKSNRFKCSMCQGSHKNSEFPVNKSLKNLMDASPSEVFRGDLVERFKANLNEIESRKVELEEILMNGADRVKEHCIELRLDVDLATETALEEIRQHRDTILKQIDDYEAKTVALIQTEQKTRSEFESSIKSMDEFAKEWKSYLTRAKINEKEVAVRNEAALELIKKAKREKRNLDSFVFNKRMVLFVKNEKSVEMSNIGVVKYKNVGSIDLKDLKQIDITDIVNGGGKVQVYPHDDGTYFLFFVDASNYILTRIIMDSDKKIILPSKTFTTDSTSYPIYQFKKYKNNIFVQYYTYNGYYINKLNLDLVVVNSVAISYTSFLSATDNHVYAYCNNLLYVYTKELNYFTADGTLVDQIPLDNFLDGLRLSMTIDGELLFHSDALICF